MVSILLWSLGYAVAALVMAAPFVLAYFIDTLTNPKPADSAGGFMWIFLFLSVPVGVILLIIVAIAHSIWIIKRFALFGVVEIIAHVGLLLVVVGFMLYLLYEFKTPYNDLSRHDYKDPSALYDNRPLIFMSVRSGKIEDVETLLSYGHSIEARGFNRETPLLAAALMNQWDMVLFLLEQGADHTAQSGSGERIFTLQDYVETARKRDDSYYKVVEWLDAASK